MASSFDAQLSVWVCVAEPKPTDQLRLPVYPLHVASHHHRPAHRSAIPTPSPLLARPNSSDDLTSPLYTASCGLPIPQLPLSPGAHSSGRQFTTSPRSATPLPVLPSLIPSSQCIQITSILPLAVSPVCSRVCFSSSTLQTRSTRPSLSQDCLIPTANVCGSKCRHNSEWPSFDNRSLVKWVVRP